MTEIIVPTWNELTQKFGTAAVSGTRVGPFVVHREVNRCFTWTVTHEKSGHAVQQGIASRRRGLWLARKLRQFDVWDFTTKAQVQDIPADVVAQIHTLRADAKFGDCQGEVPV